jgi:hypothetical protein
METVAVIGIVVVAAAYIATTIFRKLKGGEGKAGACGCAGCGCQAGCGSNLSEGRKSPEERSAGRTTRPA